MYTVYVDSTCIHDASSPSKAVHLINPVLKLGDNIAGSFEFTMPTGNAGYNLVQRMTSTIKVYRDSKLIWTGRVVSEVEDFWKCRKCTCEGALAFLNDVIQPLQVYNNTTMVNFLTTLLNNHNSRVPNSRRVNIGAVTVNDMNDSHVYTTNYDNTWGTFKSEIFDRLGGHVRIRYVTGDEIPRLDYLSDYPKTATQEINFGNNLLDFTKNWDLSELVTVILPRGAQLDEEDDYGNKDYVTVASVNNGDKYVKNVQGYNAFGWISATIDFNSVESPSVLLNLANLYLSSLQFDEMQLNISALDLHYLTSSTVSFDLLDQVRCISAPHGMDTMFPISEMNIPLDKPESVTYTMGKVATSLSSRTFGANKNIMTKIQNFPSYNNLLDQAKQQATNILNMATTGYINIIQRNGQSWELIISNTEDVDNATKLWRFNMNGLGYSSNGGLTYDIAMTIDGSIVADFVKTGTLSDGYGLNWWNLGTGEFQLAYNTEFVNSGGSGITIGDVASVASGASSDAANAYEWADYAQTIATLAGGSAATANAIATKANNKQVGGDNLLRGTGVTFTAVTDSNTEALWSKSQWGAYSSSATITAISRASNNVIGSTPNNNIKMGVRFKITDTRYISWISQSAVPLSPNQTYTLSCYVYTITSGSFLYMQVGGYRINNQDIGNASASVPITANHWKRYSYTFRTIGNNQVATEDKTTGLYNNTVRVYFGVKGAANNAYVFICGMKLERGNVATDWSESAEDTKTSSVNQSNSYTDKAKTDSINYTNSAKNAAISYTNDAKNETIAYANGVKSASIQYTDNSVKKTAEDIVQRVNKTYKDATTYTDEAKGYIKKYFTDTVIFNRLTNNGARKGLYMIDGQLYINGTYIKTGSLDANLIRTGVIIDRYSRSSWDLTQGTLRTNYMIASNATITGDISSGPDTGYRMILSGGALYGYRDGNKYVGMISPTGSVIRLDQNNRIHYGINISAESIDIRTNNLSVLHGQSTNEVALVTWTGTFKFRTVYNMAMDMSRCNEIEHGIQCINGMIVSIW